MLYLPSLSVLAVDFAPCSLVACTVNPAQGFALMSIICPLIVPVWAAARGADANASAATRIAVSKTDFLKIFMPHSPFRRGSLVWKPPDLFGPLSLLFASYSKPDWRRQARRNRQISLAPPPLVQRDAETIRRYGIGSVAPASANARNRSRQLSHAPQAIPSS